jgi:FixJ family two-component response regulator
MQQPGATIFVVDDDEGVRNSIRFLLKSAGLTTQTLASAGYRVIPAASLAEAAQQAHDYPALSLLVTDYHLGQG